MRSQVFHDFDAFASSVRDVDSKMLLRNPQQRTWTTSSVDLGRVDVQLGRLGSGNIAQGQLRPDGYMLYVPLTQGVEYTANGVTLSQSSFAILEPGCEFCVSTKVEHDWCATFIPLDLVPDMEHTSSCKVLTPPKKLFDQVRSALLQIMSAASECDEFESSAGAVQAAADAQNLFLEAVTGPPADLTPIGRTRVPRDEIIRSSMELLDQRGNYSVSVRELAEVASVSERTLRTAFNEYFGVGPVRYLQLRHLHHVHRALKMADPDEQTVSQVLVEHGEYAFSRFAARYQKLFGEFPSETLRGH